MFRSLHMKLVLILVLLIVSVMAVVGTFLINSVSNFYLDEFQTQVEQVFSEKEGENPLVQLEEIARGENGAQDLSDRLSYYSVALGIGTNRIYAVLDENGEFLTGSNPNVASTIVKTQNILAAMNGKIGDSGSMADSQMDYAIPLSGENGDLCSIIYIRDNKVTVQTLTGQFFIIVIQAMLFGLLVAIMLSFVLSKTITTPIENITKSALKLSEGDFSEQIPIQSGDEIGTLTSTFNSMASTLESTIEQVQDERDKLNTLFLHMKDGVAAFTSSGKLIHMNPATEKLLEITPREDMTFHDIFPSMKLPKATGTHGFVQTEVVEENKALTVLLATYGGVDGDGGLMAVIHDVTEQRKLENTRREFVANVSHELRTPLTNITSYTETLIDAADELPPDMIRKFLGIIENEAGRMTRIVSDLLTLSKFDYGKMDLRFSHFALKTMLENVHAAMVLQAGAQGHSLELNVIGKLPAMVGDRARLEQVIVNVLSNAVKYTPQGGEISIYAKQTDKTVQIKISDNGLGIPKEDLPRLFERFYRVDKARSREKGGTGLGLSIAKQIVEAHKGQITLDSKEGKGTTVSILLPVDLEADEET